MSATAIGVTGAWGFLGQHVLRTLTAHACDAVAFEGDICDPGQVGPFVERCDRVIHLAGKNRGPADEILRVNTEGVRHLAEAAERVGGRHIVFASSSLVERDPHSAYARSKLAGEDRLASLAGTRRCKVSVLRLANVYGPGSKPFYNSVAATFCWYAANGLGDQTPIHGDGSQEIPFIPVDEATAALVGCLDQQRDFERRVVAGQRLSVRELADAVRDPEIRRRYPALQSEFEFFARAGLPQQKPVRRYPVHAGPTGFFQELLHADETRFGQLSLCAIAPFHTRGGHFHRHKEEWFCVVAGRMALDFHNPDGTYRLTQLLQADDRRFVHVPPPVPHAVRNIGPDEVHLLIVASEVFDPASPDTYPMRRRPPEPRHGADEG